MIVGINGDDLELVTTIMLALLLLLEKMVTATRSTTSTTKKGTCGLTACDRPAACQPRPTYLNLVYHSCILIYNDTKFVENVITVKYKCRVHTELCLI